MKIRALSKLTGQLGMFAAVTLCAVSILGNVSVTRADASTDFDSLQEGFLPTEVTVDGISFYDAKVFPNDREFAPFVAENASRYFDENPDLEPFFSRPNVFQISGYITGDGWLITRFYQIYFSTGHIETNADLEFFYKSFGDEFLGTTVALQGLMRGEVVVEDSFVITVDSKAVQHEQLAISGVPFDEMRLICRQGAWGILGSIDNLVISNQSPSDLFVYEPVPARAGEQNSITADWPTPGERVFFGYGLKPGSTKVPGCPGLSVSIRNAKILGSAITNANGQATHQFNAPASVAGKAVYLQAVQMDTCSKSNLVAVRFD